MVVQQSLPPKSREPPHGQNYMRTHEAWDSKASRSPAAHACARCDRVILEPVPSPFVVFGVSCLPELEGLFFIIVEPRSYAIETSARG